MRESLISGAGAAGAATPGPRQHRRKNGPTSGRLVRVFERTEGVIERVEDAELGAVVVAHQVRAAVELDEAGELAAARRDVHVGVGLLPGQRIGRGKVVVLMVMLIAVWRTRVALRKM